MCVGFIHLVKKTLYKASFEYILRDMKCVAFIVVAVFFLS
jgi:hypothetical protein